MKLRKLEIHEHNQTRSLWERVFPEDEKAFLDYYYFFKTRENEIYAIEEADEIHAMLHLNPYPLQMGEAAFIGHYIVAVATDARYRKRGYMRALLEQALKEMYKRKELFTFLMPAAEAIYLPYDFRTVYEQDVETIMGNAFTEVQEAERTSCTVREAGLGDGARLAELFSSCVAEQIQVYAKRTEQYYQTLLFEQQSEQGGIRLLYDEAECVGAFLYGDEDGLEIREPFCVSGYEKALRHAILQLCKEKKREEATIYAAFPSKGKTRTQEAAPKIMIRILHLAELLKCVRIRPDVKIQCSFAVIDPLLHQNSRVWRLEGTRDCLQVRETEDSEGILSISALTELLFGRKTVGQIMEEEGVFLSMHLQEELQKIEPFSSIYLNEIV